MPSVPRLPGEAHPDVTGCTCVWRDEVTEGRLRKHQMHLQTLIAEPSESLGKSRETSQAQADALSPQAIMLTAACWQRERHIPGL